MRYIILFLFVTLCSCSSDLSTALKIIDNDMELKYSDCEQLIDSFTSRKTIKKQIYSSPFVVIVDDDRAEKYSFFRDERVIYKGEVTKAWRDRMVGESSECYPLHVEDVKTIISINAGREKSENSK